MHSPRLLRELPKSAIVPAYAVIAALFLTSAWFWSHDKQALNVPSEAADSKKGDPKLLEPQEPDSLNELQARAQKGDVQAQFNLGLWYYFGEGVPKDYTEAVNWFRKAAEQGSAVAQFNLAVCYAQGEGVLKDYAEAVKWYRK